MGKADMNKLSKAAVFFGEIPEKRKTAFYFGQERAAEALADFNEHGEAIGFSKGQFSFVELIDALLDKTGPARLTVATWTAAAGDASFIGQWAQQSRILDCRWLVDYSFLSRRGGMEALTALLERFGRDSVRVTKTHAKFALLEGERMNIACMTSMNLNQNPRFEYFHCSTDARLVASLCEIVDECWQSPAAAEQMDWRPQDHKDGFDALLSPESEWAHLTPAGAVC